MFIQNLSDGSIPLIASAVPTASTESVLLTLSNGSITECIPPLEEVSSSLEKLNLMTYIVKQALDAYLCYQAQKFFRFDAIVGDEACQIRAFKLAHLNQQNYSVRNGIEGCQNLLSQIERVTEIFKLIKQKADVRKKGINQKICELMKKQEMILGRKLSKNENKELKTGFQQDLDLIERDFREEICQVFDLEQLKLNLKLDFDERFLLNSYLLCKVKDSVPIKNGQMKDVQDRTSLDLLKRDDLKIDGGLLEKIYEISKRSLMEQSFEIVREESQLLLGRVDSTLVNLESKSLSLSIPFLIGIETLFKRASILQIPLMLKIRNQSDSPLDPNAFVSKSFFVGDGNGDFTLVENIENSSAMVIKCRSSLPAQTLLRPSYLLDVLQKSGSLFRMILLNGAQHNQYKGRNVSRNMFEEVSDLEAERKEEFIQLYEEAIANGFSNGSSNENLNLCIIEHVYFDRIEEGEL